MAVIRDGVSIPLKPSIARADISPHSVSSYKKTSDGRHEINGPLTWEAFQNTDAYKGLIRDSGSEGLQRDVVRAAQSSETLRLLENAYNNLGTTQQSTMRVIVESEVVTGNDGQETTIPKHILVARLNTENMTAKLENMVVYNVKNLQRTSLGDFTLEMPPAAVKTHNYALTQGHANDITARLHVVPEYGPDFPVITRDKKSFAVAPMDKAQLEAHSMYRGLPEATKTELMAQVAAKAGDEGNRFMIVGSVDTEGRLTPERVLSGSLSGHLDADKGYNLHLEQSFNLKNNKTSTLERDGGQTPIPVSQGKISEKTAEDVTSMVSNRAARQTISQAPKATNPEFDALLAKGPTGEVQYEGAAPSTPAMAKPKAVGVA
jgi:hypothetical protein